MTSTVTVYTHLAAAAKITFEVQEATRVKFASVGGGDGVPPGMQITDAEQVLCWVTAQDFGLAIVEDGETKITVMASPAAS